MKDKLIKYGLYNLSDSLKVNNPILFNKVMNLIKSLLMGKEEFLRDLQNKQGRGNVYEDDIDDYMD